MILRDVYYNRRVFLYVQKLVQRHLVVLEQWGMHADCSRTTAVQELAATGQPLKTRLTWVSDFHLHPLLKEYTLTYALNFSSSRHRN